MEESDNVDLKPCACGCGESMIPFTVEKGKIRKDRPIRFKPQHYQKKFPTFKKGENNFAWVGGRVSDKRGYILIYKPEHPFHNSAGYVREHRFVYEEFHKCCILPWIDVHHINEIKDDNRVENLQLMTSSQHLSHHHKRTFFDRICSSCGNNKTRCYWHKDGKGGFLCTNCYQNRRRRQKRLLAVIPP